MPPPCVRTMEVETRGRTGSPDCRAHARRHARKREDTDLVWRNPNAVSYIDAAIFGSNAIVRSRTGRSVVMAKEAKLISQWIRPLMFLIIPVLALIVYAVATKEWSALLGLIPASGALFVSPPKVGSAKGVGFVGPLVGALVAGALSLCLVACAPGLIGPSTPAGAKLICEGALTTVDGSLLIAEDYVSPETASELEKYREAIEVLRPLCPALADLLEAAQPVP